MAKSKSLVIEKWMWLGLFAYGWQYLTHKDTRALDSIVAPDCAEIFLAGIQLLERKLRRGLLEKATQQ